VRERGLVGSGFSGEGFLGEVTQDSFVEGGEGLEFGGGEQVDEMPADIMHVLGRCVLDGAASGGQKADHGAAAVGRVGFADDQPTLLHAPDLVGEPAKNSVHLVLVADRHDEETGRLTGLGARPLNEIRVPPAALPPGVAAVRQTTFADPEGNEFDLVTWQPA
jgi:Glyoxalase-like domain